MVGPLLISFFYELAIFAAGDVTSHFNPALGHNVRLTEHSWDPQLNAPHPGSPSGEETFIGDYFGNITDRTTDVSTFVSTYNDGPNPNHYQQQVVAKIKVPSG